MSVEAFAIANCDDAFVFWRIEKPIADCFGFAIEREKKGSNGGVARTFLHNRMGFAKDDPKPGDHRPSNVWPFQRFSWADHDANCGERVRYRVIPMIHDGGGLHQALDGASSWTDWLELSADAGDGISAYFNRGLVISQFMSRYLEDLRVKNGLTTQLDALKLFKKELGEHEDNIQRFLSGELRNQMFTLLDDAKKKKQHVYAALFELSSNELLDKLVALGPRAHVVLANGSVSQKKGQSMVDARKGDENKTARALLKKKKVEVVDRFVSPAPLGHNKFVVVADAKKKPLAAWTGSTNWTPTGLCTQVNNGLLVSDPAFADVYMQQWNALRDAKSTFPASLFDANAKPKSKKVGASTTRTWFTPVKKGADLAALEEVVNGAEDAILFLMFQPGGKATFESLRKRFDNPGRLYVKGVVSTLPSDKEQNPGHVDVAVVGDGKRRALGLDIVQPEGFKTPFASWAATVTRNEFIPTLGGVIGFAIVHSKLIVVDPFTKPVVVTGSHNFSASASQKNDENFVIVRGNTTLALEYSAHILSVYQHFRWLKQVSENERARKKNPAKKPFSGVLREKDTWQASHLTGDSKRELEFWVR